MKISAEGILGIAQKVKTPLALAGLAVGVFYLIFKKVLSLNVFSNVGSSGTVELLKSILDKVFWLAVIGVTLGVVSYVIAMFLNRRVAGRKSEVELIDARLEPRHNAYEEVLGPDGKVIRRKDAQR